MSFANQPVANLKVQGPLWLLAIWALWSIAMVMLNIGPGHELMVDPDDFMRLAQVRDFLGGQSWFDVTQYRINPPLGGAMHWSRLIDVPIAGAIWAGGIFLPADLAEYVAITAIPIMLLGLLMLLVYRTLRQFADEKVALFAAFLLPTFPLIVRQFLPGRIDHHSWQIVMAALAMCALFDRNLKRSAWTMAFALAFWMHISIEGLPYVAIFGAVLAAFYVFPKATLASEPDDRLIHFANGLALFSAGFFVATQSTKNFSIPYCDAVSWPLLVAFAAVSIGLTIMHYALKPATAAWRFGSIAVIGAAGAAAYLGFSDSCALDPFGQLTPLVREFWHETISEGLAIDKQAAAIIALLAFVPLLAGLWIAYIVRSTSDPLLRKQWLTLAALIILASILSFKVQRTAGVAELFALPAIAALTAEVVRRIGQSTRMLIRILGTVLATVALSPMMAFIAGDALSTAPSKPEQSQKPKTGKRGCNHADLRKLAPGHIFTTMAAGPEILYRTKHSVFVSGYHRNNLAMDTLISTMLGDTANAPAVLQAAKVDYVIFCPTHFEAMSYLHASKSGFAATLMSTKHPLWLEPVPLFADSEMRVYRFVHGSRGK
jgi:hypothetical protein